MVFCIYVSHFQIYYNHFFDFFSPGMFFLNKNQKNLDFFEKNSRNIQKVFELY